MIQEFPGHHQGREGIIGAEDNGDGEGKQGPTSLTWRNARGRRSRSSILATPRLEMNQAQGPIRKTPARAGPGPSRRLRIVRLIGLITLAATLLGIAGSWWY